MENPDPVENCLRFATAMNKADLSCRHEREKNFLHEGKKHCLDLWKKLVSPTFPLHFLPHLLNECTIVNF